MSLDSILRRLQLRRPARRASHRHSSHKPRFEALEDRCLLSLTTFASYSAGTEPQNVVAADFNDDGRLDLAVANSSANSVSVLLGNANGSFSRLGASTPARTRSRSRSATSTATARWTWPWPIAGPTA